MRTLNKGNLAIVWGGQFGSEGKGEIAAFLAENQHYKVGVRVGGPNAGHTVHLKDGSKFVVQSLPIPAALGGTGIIGPAGVIIWDILEQEAQEAYDRLGFAPSLIIDGNAALITRAHMAQEAFLKDTIGSTGEGVGAVTAAKVMREQQVVISNPYIREELLHAAKGVACLGRTAIGVNDTSHLANDMLEDGRNVLIEGTQGYGLSLHTGGFYPKCTSRECTPFGLLAETGINPSHAAGLDSIMVVRTYPIRVGGNSGPLENEITWDDLRERTNGYVSTPEMTTVTKKIRRIAEIDYDLLRRAVYQCAPKCIALTFLDYQFPELAGSRDILQIEEIAGKYIGVLERQLYDTPVRYVSTGPGIVTDLMSINSK